MIWADNETLKVWHMLGWAMTRWTWNGALRKRKPPWMCMLLTKRKTAIQCAYEGAKQCFTWILHSQQKCNKCTTMQFSASNDVKRGRIGNNYLSRHASSKYRHLSPSFPGPRGNPYLSPLYSNPQEKYPQFQLREDYCFPICCPVQTQPYQSKPGQLLFHILLMYWKALHSRLPLTAAHEQVSVPNSTMENNQAFLLD